MTCVNSSSDFTIADPPKESTVSLDSVEFGSTDNPRYDELIVDEKEISLIQILKAQERLIERLERLVERLEAENQELKDKQFYIPNETKEGSETHQNMPQGVILKSKFRDNVEDLLRQKAIERIQK